MTSNPCLEYVDVYGRKTDLVHIAKGATYPINILGNAATATNDSEGNNIAETYAKKSEAIAFAPQAQVFDLTTNLHVRINMDNAEACNMAYLEALDKSTGTWTIHNDGNDRIYVMRFGGRLPIPHGEFIDSNATSTFVLDSDSFGLLVWKLGEQTK